MFTIKQCDNEGNVWLKQCADISISNKDGMLWIVCTDIDGKEIAGISGWPETDPTEDSLYIMNEAGATVSSHRFRPSAHSSLKSNGGGTCSTERDNSAPWRPNAPFVKIEAQLAA